MFNLHLPLLVSTTRFSYPSNFFALFVLFSFFSAYYPNGLSRLRFSSSRDSVCFPIKLSLPSRFSLRLYLQEISIWYSNRGAPSTTNSHSIDPTWNRNPEEEDSDSLDTSIDPRSSLWWWETCLFLGLTDLFISLYSAYPFYSLTNYPVQFTGLHAVSTVVYGQSSPPSCFLRHTNHFFLALYRWKVFDPCDKSVSRRVRVNVCRRVVTCLYTIYDKRGEVRKIFFFFLFFFERSKRISENSRFTNFRRSHRLSWILKIQFS